MEDARDDAIVRAVQERIDEMYTRLASEFGQRHDLNRRDNTLIQEQITALNDRFTLLERRIDGLERKAGFNLLLDEARKAARDAAGSKSSPAAGTSRPVAIDQACAAAPEGEPVMVLVPEFGLEIEPEPGSDPEAVWPAALHAIEGAAHGGRRRR